jgi:hypothetical protein
MMGLWQMNCGFVADRANMATLERQELLGKAMRDPQQMRDHSIDGQGRLMLTIELCANER